MKKLARFALLSLLPAVMGVHAVATDNFARWEKDIAAFEKADQTNPPPKNAVLFVGSSGIRRWKTLAQDFPGCRVINRGFGGSQIADSAHFADRIVLPYAPRLIILRAGGNDIAAGKSPEQVFGDFKDFVAAVRAKLPTVDIIFLGWNPTPARWKNRDREQALNALIRDYIGRQPHLKYVDTWDKVLGPDGLPRPELFVTDKLHFTPAGYKILIDLLKPLLATP
ncbi:MAG: GDSL-type esterase/lipase family protein [Kiritimatiellaeota bacterium]|nr:GDSL-type esterase/lipase family protein [Kiritimatiellota bacterium]